MVTIDARGKVCPMPIVMLTKEVRNLAKGGLIELLADDPGIVYDIRAWAKSWGHRIVLEEKKDDYYRYVIEIKK